MRTDTNLKKIGYIAADMSQYPTNSINIDPAGSVKTITIARGDPANLVKKSGNPAANVPDWRTTYADKDGVVRIRPSYPDTSYQSYLKAGGNLLGIGYSSWKDQLEQNYNTAVAAYEDWYNSMPQQVERISQAGLNTNLAYGAASPGSAGDTSMVTPSGAAPGEIFAQGAGVISSLFGNLKTLAEAATIVNQLPESSFKGKLAKQLDVAAQAGAINNEAGYMSQLMAARQSLGVGRSKAQAESSKAAYESAQAKAEEEMIKYLTSTDEHGKPVADISKSLFGESKGASLKNAIVEYKSNQKRFDKLFSDDRYWNATIDKMIADAYISESEAWRLKQIREDSNMGNAEKVLAMEKGLPGFVSRLSFFLSSVLVGGIKNGIPFNSTPMR